MTWDISTPAGDSKTKFGDDYLRELKVDLETALNKAGVFPINAASPKFQVRGKKGVLSSRPGVSSGGLYFATDMNTLYRDNGTSWESVGSYFASGTKAFFYNGTAPTGWSIIPGASGYNDRMIFINSGSAGTTGGSWGTTIASQTQAHTHNVATFQGNKVLEFHYRFYKGTYGGSDWVEIGVGNASLRSFITFADRTTGSVSYCSADATISAGDNMVSSSDNMTHNHTATHTSAQHQIARVLLCQKN